MKKFVSDEVHKALVDGLVKDRQIKKHKAGETALLCYATMDISGGHTARRMAARRVISSVLRRNNVSERRITLFVNKMGRATRGQVANYLILLKPYREVREWLETEAG